MSESIAAAADRGVVSVLDYYQLETGRVVRVVGEARDTLTLEAVETGERFPVRREPFEADVRSGHLQAVQPEWQLVGDTGEDERE